MKMHCWFIFWLSIILSYRIDFNSTWLNITELMPKNIENCKKIQIKKRFHSFVSALLWKHTADLSLDCRLFYPTEMFLTEMFLTWPNITELMPKNIENCRRIQIKKRFHIFVSARLWKCTADLSFDCRLFYPIEMVLTQHGSTLLNWCLKTLKTVKKFK